MTNNNANLAQSIRQRLLNMANKTGQDYNRLLVRYSLERLLFRIGQSPSAGRFILKGAMLLAAWTDRQYRATQDLDLLGTGDNSPEELARAFREIAATPASTPDGMTYLAESVATDLIREDMRYEGVRVRLESRLGNARIPLIVDVGFGDAITPAPQTAEFPALLDMPAPTIRMYPRETVVAE
ncbi:MAG: nucleotidyl transferase AbiEii/AbiGii toxin family protein, partial [Phycisphaerae bacterium]|nr:nucleotidyl transferase AbiEii/AbiGii toxin family protein [Phycisphaerae bacterium]